MTDPLYKLTDQLAEFRDMESEFDPEVFADTFESMLGDFETKGLQVGIFVKQLNLDAKQIQGQIDVFANEIADLAKRQATIQKRATDIQAYLRANLISAGFESKKISNPLVEVGWRKQPEKLGEFDEADVPSQFIEDVPATTKIDRRGLLAAAKADRKLGIPVVREPVKMVIK